MANFAQIKNILFDLGGVILDLDVHGTLEKFLNMGLKKELLNYPENFHTDIFFNYETGRTTTEQFRDSIRNYSGIDFSDREFDDAWCAMLTRVPVRRIELLKSLNERYSLYMLSNTSPLHIEHFEQMFLDTAGFPFNEVFTGTYYSYKIGLHKPDSEAFEHVLKDAEILAEETLFLDDNIHNIKTAKALGFNAIHITEHLRMEDLGFDM